jgi:ribosomal protein S18 acetylase RimI-like enzyme
MHIRPANLPEDIPAIARLHVDTWRAAYNRIMPQEFLDSLTYADREEQLGERFETWKGGFVFVACEASEIVGFVWAGPAHSAQPAGDAEIYSLYVAPGKQGRGVGRALMQTAARELLGRGLSSAFLYVFKENAPARRFYESLGGRLAGEKLYSPGAFTISEVSYAWDDLAALLPAEANQ